MYIYPRLLDYRNGVEKNNIQCVPNWVLNEFNDNFKPNESDLNLKWLEILDKMLFAFKSFLDFSDEDIKIVSGKQQEGLDYFAKYFKHLWD